MKAVAITYFGEKITMRNTSKAQALKHLAKHGIAKDWIYRLEVMN